MTITEAGRAEIARIEAERTAWEAEEAAAPSGLKTLAWVEVADTSWDSRNLYIVARLPQIVLAAAVAEEAGKATGSTKLRGLGLPLPFTDREGGIGIVRLWARWAKEWNGTAKLLGFDVRKGKDRSGYHLARMEIRRHDGALIAYPKLCTSPRDMEELAQRLLEVEATAVADDPLAEMARQAVTQAHCAFCCCCGRMLTDPVSVRTGIGPECGQSFHAVFLDRWRAARRGMAA